MARVFAESDFFNATAIARKHGRFPSNWVALSRHAGEYYNTPIRECAASLGVDPSDLVIIGSRGGSSSSNRNPTLLHKYLRSTFERWCKEGGGSSEREHGLYVIEFSTGVIKVGTAIHVSTRIQFHARQAACFYATITRNYYIERTPVPESTLIAYCKGKGTLMSGYEYFTGLDFHDVVEFLKAEHIRLTSSLSDQADDEGPDYDVLDEADEDEYEAELVD